MYRLEWEVEDAAKQRHHQIRKLYTQRPQTRSSLIEFIIGAFRIYHLYVNSTHEPLRIYIAAHLISFIRIRWPRISIEMRRARISIGARNLPDP